MEWSKLYDKTNQPSIKEMADYIGAPDNALWNSLFSYINSAYRVKPKIAYSGCSGKPGWNVKLQKSGQSFGTLYPEEGYFTVFIVIAYTLDPVMEMVRNEFSPAMRARCDSAQDYMKLGKWMMFPVKTEEDLSDYKLLMSVKLKPNQ